MGARLDIITLPFCTSHALHLLDVSCFKQFKIAFKAYKMSKHGLIKGEVLVRNIWHGGCFWPSRKH